MKTLFFVLACFLSSLIPSFADDQDPFLNLTQWHATNRHDIASPTVPHVTASLENLKKALKSGITMATIVAQCGLPDAEYNPRKWPSPNHGIVLAGKTWIDQDLINRKGYWNFRYDLPDQGRVYITTSQEQRIESALFYSALNGQVQFLVKSP